MPKSRFPTIVLLTLIIAALLSGCAGLPARENTSPAGSLVLTGSAGIRAWATEVRDQRAYVVDQTSGLHLLSLASSNNPSEIAVYDTPGLALDVALVSDKVYVADGAQGVRVFEALSDDSLREIAHVQITGTAYALAASKTHLYVASGPAGVTVIDIRDAANPRVVGTHALGFAQALVLDEEKLYVSGVTMVYVAETFDPTQLRTVGVFDLRSETHGLALDNDRLYVAADDGLHALNVSDVTDLQEVGLYRTGIHERMIGVAVVQGAAYATSIVYDDHVQNARPTGVLYVLDTRGETSLSEVAHYVLPGPAQNVTTTNGQVVVSAQEGGMLVFGR